MGEVRYGVIQMTTTDTAAATRYWGLREQSGRYSHIYRNIVCVKMCCEADEISSIVELNIVEHYDQARPSSEEAKLFKMADYWGFKYTSESYFDMIQSSFILLRMCFAYGLEAAEAGGSGRAYRLLITEK